MRKLPTFRSTDVNTQPSEDESTKGYSALKKLIIDKLKRVETKYVDKEKRYF